MNNRIEALKRLQAIDTQLKRAEDDKLCRSKDVNKKQLQIQRKKAELAKINEDIKNFQKKVSLKELDLKSTEGEINKLKSQMNQIKNNKEFSAIKTEIAGKEANKSVLEDEILTMITNCEKIQSEYKAFEKEIEKENEQLKEIQKQVEADMGKIDAEIEALKKKHSEYAALVDYEAMQHYSRLAKNKDAVAVVNVVNKACQGCFMSITSQTLNLLMSENNLTLCHSCGRILYLDNKGE